MLLQKELLQPLPAILAPIEGGGLQGAIGEVEGIVVGGEGRLSVRPPGGVLAAGQVAPVDAGLERLLIELL